MLSSTTKLASRRGMAHLPYYYSRRIVMIINHGRSGSLLTDSASLVNAGRIRHFSGSNSTNMLWKNAKPCPSYGQQYHHQHHHPLLQQLPQRQQQQRRHYIFFPSDWSELTFRWKLFREKHLPTKVQVKVQDRYQLQKLRLKDRYQLQKLKIKDRYQLQTLKIKHRYWNDRQIMKDRYQNKKVQLERNYRFERDKFRRRYQNTRLKYRRQVDTYYESRIQNQVQSMSSQLRQRRMEFNKRWTARRRDWVTDSTTTFKHYLARRRQERQRQLVANQVFTIEEYALPHWFDPIDGRPLTSRDPAGRFVNPWMSWSTNGVQSVYNILKWRYQRAIREWKARGVMSFVPKDLSQMLFGSALSGLQDTSTILRLPQSIQHLHNQPKSISTTDIQLTWIGHSTCLVKMGNATILTDPIFSHRCSPLQRMPGVGVARDIPPSMTIDELPSQIDVCLISHDHFDHLDQLSVSKLRDRVQCWVLPKGLPEWMESRCSVDPDRMIELEWWESVHLIQTSNNNGMELSKWEVVKDLDRHNANGSIDGNNTMTVTCCPAQHWSSRNLMDRCKRLWCGFAVETQTQIQQQSPIQQDPIVQKFYFAGDTGMPSNGFPLFEQIGDFCGHGKYHNRPQPSTTDESQSGSKQPTPATEPMKFHPFDLAAIPIGAYDPPFLMRQAHMDPAEAVQCSKQLQARKSVAIHWGTFALSEEPMEEPPERLKESLKLPDNAQVDFVALPFGGSLRVPAIVKDKNDAAEDLVKAIT